MSIIRQAAKARMNKLKLKPGDLCRLLADKDICRATVYNFLKGKDIKSDKLVMILEALGLAIK